MSCDIKYLECLTLSWLNSTYYWA